MNTSRRRSKPRKDGKEVSDLGQTTEWVAENPQGDQPISNTETSTSSGQGPTVPSNLIFLNVDIAHTDGNGQIRSMLMKEHYRKKRLLDKKRKDEGSGSSSLQNRPLLPLQGNHQDVGEEEKASITTANVSSANTVLASSSCGHTGRGIQPSSAIIGPVSLSEASYPQVASFLADDPTRLEAPRNFHQDLTTSFATLSMAVPRGNDVDPLNLLPLKPGSEEYIFFRHYLRLPRVILEITHETSLNESFHVPLASRFPVLAKSFIAVLSRYLDSQMPNPSHQRSIYYHNSIVELLNQELQLEMRNDDSILLGILGVMSSTFVGGDHAEFEMHCRGLSSLIEQRMILTHDPEVMAYFVCTCLLYGKALTRIVSTKAISQSLQYDVYGNMITYSNVHGNLTDMLMSVYRRVQAFHGHGLSEDRSPAEVFLFQPGSTMNKILWRQIETPSLDFWRRAFEQAHHPWLVVYLNLLRQDLQNTPAHHRDEIYLSIIDGLATGNINKYSTSVSINWFLMAKFRHHMNRTYQALLLVRTLLSVSDHKYQAALRLLVWNLCPNDDLPLISADTMLEIAEEVAAIF